MKRATMNHISVIGILLGIILIAAMTAGCNRQPASVVLPTVNDTFVDVDGLRQASVRTVSSYPTEDLHLGYAGDMASSPVFADGAMYVFTKAKGDKTQITTWLQTTGEKGWSVAVDLIPWPASLSCADGNLYFAGSRSNAHDSIVCMDESSGVVRWSEPLSAASPGSVILSAVTPITVPSKGLSSDQVCAVVFNPRASSRSDRSGIWVWNATGIPAAQITYPTLSYAFSFTPIPLLYDGTTIYAALPVSTPRDRTVSTTELGATYTDLVAVNAATRRIRVLCSLRGVVRQLLKQDGHLVMLRENRDGTTATTINVIAPSVVPEMHISAEEPYYTGTSWTSIAVDGTRVYAAASDGTVTAFPLASLDKSWTHPFASYKSQFISGVDAGKPVDYHPAMTLTATRDVLYVQDGGGLVAALDPATGKELWSKRISQVVWGQTSVDNLFVLKPVDKGFFVFASAGKVDLWK